jgi:hypothetical protein
MQTLSPVKTAAKHATMVDSTATPDMAQAIPSVVVTATSPRSGDSTSCSSHDHVPSRGGVGFATEPSHLEPLKQVDAPKGKKAVSPKKMLKRCVSFAAECERGGVASACRIPAMFRLLVNDGDSIGGAC